MEKLIKLHRDLSVVEYFFWGRTSNGGEPKALSIFFIGLLQSFEKKSEIHFFKFSKNRNVSEFTFT